MGAFQLFDFPAQNPGRRPWRASLENLAILIPSQVLHVTRMKGHLKLTKNSPQLILQILERNGRYKPPRLSRIEIGL